ncbi:MAG: PepSY domain-containing protein [Bacteroidota bacterium]
MTISIWRFSHLILAVSSAIFIFIATATGIVLAFEPISNQLKPYAIKNADALSLAETIGTLQSKYEEVVTLEVDKNDFVKASVITKEGESDTFYINPATGEKIGDPIKKAPVFEFATNLHRSLFLKSTGRFLVGLFSFFLLLIAITGNKLIKKRQGGSKRFFSKVVKENFEQYYHVVIGRYALIPLIIITITGVFLSLEKFDLLPSDRIMHNSNEVTPSSNKIAVKDFEIFKTTLLGELESLEFPFSDDEEDYFIMELKDRELYIHQYSGDIISLGQKPLVQLASNVSMVLHTGQGTLIWAVVLLLSCFAILFFMYSGLAMTLRRKKETSKIKNSYGKDEAEYIILVGSETGHTTRFAQLFSDALIKENKSVFLDQLNNYTTYKKAKQLIVFTATYGEGEAPSNAKNFEVLLAMVEQAQNIRYSVLGFGSLMYPEFCKYAIVVDSLLQKHKSFTPNIPLFKINNQSFEAFKTWISEWNVSTQQSIVVKPLKPSFKRRKLKEFEVVNVTSPNEDDTFLLQLKPKKYSKFQSGDLIAFYPEEDHVERLYSIGKIDDMICLSIKKHEFGVCSNHLSELKINTMTKAKIKRNLDFHLPSYAKDVVMIANGTGIAPFLGMISEKRPDLKRHLFWGGRTQESLQLYAEFIDAAFKKDALTSFHIAYSQDKNKEAYIQEIVKEKQELICDVLQREGIIMICGSIAMQNGTLEVLNTMTTEQLGEPLSVFENNEQIKMDCY